MLLRVPSFDSLIEHFLSLPSNDDFLLSFIRVSFSSLLSPSKSIILDSSFQLCSSFLSYSSTRNIMMYSSSFIQFLSWLIAPFPSFLSFFFFSSFHLIHPSSRMNDPWFLIQHQSNSQSLSFSSIVNLFSRWWQRFISLYFILLLKFLLHQKLLRRKRYWLRRDTDEEEYLITDTSVTLWSSFSWSWSIHQSFNTPSFLVKKIYPLPSFSQVHSQVENFNQNAVTRDWIEWERERREGEREKRKKEEQKVSEERGIQLFPLFLFSLFFFFLPSFTILLLFTPLFLGW